MSDGWAVLLITVAMLCVGGAIFTLIRSTKKSKRRLDENSRTQTGLSQLQGGSITVKLASGVLMHISDLEGNADDFRFLRFMLEDEEGAAAFERAVIEKDSGIGARERRTGLLLTIGAFTTFVGGAIASARSAEILGSLLTTVGIAFSSIIVRLIVNTAGRHKLTKNESENDLD